MKTLIACSTQPETWLVMFAYQSIRRFIGACYGDDHRFHPFIRNMTQFQLHDLGLGLYRLEARSKINRSLSEALELVMTFYNADYFFASPVASQISDKWLELDSFAFHHVSLKRVGDSEEYFQDLSDRLEVQHEEKIVCEPLEGIIFHLKEKGGSPEIKIVPTLATEESEETEGSIHPYLAWMDQSEAQSFSIVAEFPFNGLEQYIQADKDARSALRQH